MLENIDGSRIIYVSLAQNLKNRFLRVRTLISPFRTQRHFRRVAFTRVIIFLPRFCDLGLHFGAKSSLRTFQIGKVYKNILLAFLLYFVTLNVVMLLMMPIEGAMLTVQVLKI